MHSSLGASVAGPRGTAEFLLPVGGRASQTERRQVWEWPGVYLEAEYHAVWRNPEGALVDLTPKDVPTKKILFLADPSRPYDGRRRRNEMSPLADHEAIRDFIDACNEEADIKNRGDRALLDKFTLNFQETLRMEELTELMGQAILWIDRFAGQPGKTSPCWCGSGRAYKSCHLGQQ